MSTPSLLEEKSIDDVCQWLEDCGFSESILRTFRGKTSYPHDLYLCSGISMSVYVTAEQDMDGKAIAFGLATAPGPDWLKDLIPALGIRLKLHNCLRSWYTDCQVRRKGIKCLCVQ